jgi:CIC family chloride channel protein
VPAVDGLLAGILAYYFERDRTRDGIPGVIDAVASRGSIIKGRVSILKTIGSALSIGTGGAGGKEGPIVQIGASIGSAFGQYLSTSSDRLKILVGCGAAAGLSAAFNVPIGGALFAMEIILHTFNARSVP